MTVFSTEYSESQDLRSQVLTHRGPGDKRQVFTWVFM